MLKRVTKVTSLLVAAASIVSMVPAMAADIKKFDTTDGTIYNAMAKGGGKFIIDGELDGKDEAIYYLVGGKYTKLDNASPGDTMNDVIFGKYLKMNDGDYYIDLTDGKKIEEDIDQNSKDDSASAVRKKIKNDNDGRFAESTYDGKIVAADVLISGATSTWSQYSYDLKTPDLTGKTKSKIYADLGGNYVDADYNLGNVRVYTTGTSVTIKNTEDTYEVTKGGHTYEIKAQIKSALQAPALVKDSPYTENANDFYRLAELSIWGREKGGDGVYKDITDTVEFGPASNHHAALVKDAAYGKYVEVMQVISKAQASDDIDGIKYAKDVGTYFVADKDGNEEKILGLGTSDEHGSYKMSGNAYGLQSMLTDNANKKLYAQTVSFKTENGFNYVDIGDEESTDFDVYASGSGQIFCIDGGYIKKWNNKDSFDKLYKIDGGMTKMSVTSANGIIAWNEDNKMYTVIDVPPGAPAGDKAATGDNVAKEDKITTATTQVVKTGWAKAADGTWNYVKTDGTKATGWFQDGAAWYYLKADGVMTTGWQSVGGTWYYLNASGAMQTGWINDNGTWYYCNASGAMLANTTVNGYILGANGTWVK